MYTLIIEVRPNISQTAETARELLHRSLYHLEEIVLISECCSDAKNSTRLVCQLVAPSIDLIKTLISKMAPQTEKIRLFINNTEYDVKLTQ